MNIHAAHDLRSWLGAHLDPLEATEASVRGSCDFDLDPEPWPEPPPTLTPAAVLVALVDREQGPSVILTRRSETLRKHTGQVALPGGRLDPGETPWDAALREAHEEIGLAPEYVTLVGLSSPHRTGTGYLITPVVGFVQPGFSLVPNADEVAEIFETPFDFLMDPANHEQRVIEHPGGRVRRFYSITHEDRVIWGATAAILRKLYDRLNGLAVA